ncbi:potassium channel family protein [Deinococcus peraridilitoris]|uniref:K+ transport system, NAD-binding component n=1 Tax=Deinococcus peraridilitoris (strain DSM 19664 / LMG 22246 / CIP 109416 / KR-200) TaxID=937777 RepID=K9ZZ93_DEIPD|nr:TrkA family potassium uptake protein [Deinococcus peraridilitoris]AFZ66519.1 K+ transport system, NAD-binding component [Deinococcus peraridilitoris DSM 19664]
MKSKQCLVIGLGRFGSAVATTLYELGHEVVAVDVEEDNVQRVMNLVTHAAILDATDERALRSIGVGEFDEVVIAIGSDIKSNILATLAAKNLGARHVVSKATDEVAARVLEKIGADEVIRPEHDMGVRTAQRIGGIRRKDTPDLGPNTSIVELGVNERLRGTLKELNLSNRFGVQVIALNRGGRVEVAPRADEDLRLHDTLVIVGDNHAIEELRRFRGED